MVLMGGASNLELQITRPNLYRRTKDECATVPLVDEGRKRVIAIMASILAARKLAQFDSGARVPVTINAIADAVRWAEHNG